MKAHISFLLLLFLGLSCGDQKIDTRKAREEMESREIKRVSEGEIIEKALEMGNSDAMGGRFVAFDAIDEFKGKSFELLDAYAYSFKNDIDSDASVQILEGDTVILYAKPMIVDEVNGVQIKMISRKEIVLAIKK